MGGNALSKRLERAEITGVFALENADLDEIPPRLFELHKTVRVLDLSQNRITKMSEEREEALLLIILPILRNL